MEAHHNNLLIKHMNPLNILLQFQVSTEISDTKLVIFWVAVAICVAVFIYFLRRTDRLINERALAEQEAQLPKKQEINNDDVHEEEAAAIALAMHLYKTQMHDMESFSITLRKVSRIYSPWNSKIYTLRQNPR
jgi:hypothetical protein